MKRTASFLQRTVALVAAGFAVWSSGAGHAGEWQPTEDDELLLELRSGAYRLGEPMRGYQTPTGTCVDFADLIQALDLPVRLDKKSRRATGWLFAEDQRFVLDREANAVQTMNGNRSIAPGAIFDTPSGWCMDLAALSTWMGVRLKPDLSNLAVVLESDRKLPFLEAIERKSRAARLRTPSFGEFDLAKLPQAQLPYKTWRTPSVDVQIQADWSRKTGATVRYEALAAGEALGMSYTARLAGSGLDAPEAFRLKLYRNDPAGELLGPLKATQAAFGDVETLRGALTAQSAYGRGAFISNQPVNRPGRFGATAIRGTLPAGWDAELYRNGALRAYQADRGDGRYDFSDIELLFGENDFEVVLYGPQGQVRHERSSIPVGLQAIPAGKTWYWGGIVDGGRDLIDLSGSFANPHTGWRWGVGVERGIDKRTSAGIEYQSLVLAGRRQNYIEATLNRAVGPMLLQLSGAQQLGAGRAWRAEAIGRVGGVNVAADALWIDGDFESELVKAQQRGEFGLRVNTDIKLSSWRLPVEASVRQTLSRNGAKVNEWLLRSSMHMGRTSLTVELARRTASGGVAGAGQTGTKVNLVGNTVIGRVRLRGTARLAVDGPFYGLESAQVVAETPLDKRSTLRGGYEYDVANGRSELMLGYVRQFDRFALRAEGRADNHGRLGIGLTLGFSLGPDPVDGGWRVSRERLAETGQASVEVFRDDNGDGYRQAGEEGVEGVTIEAGFKHSETHTDKAGRTVVDGLSPYVPVLVSIDTGKLPDPLLQPKGQGMVVIPRPGVSAQVLLPLAPTGEIEAMLNGTDGEPRGGVEIELVDGTGAVVRRAVSDFDGYLLFDAVPYGSYRLRVGAASAKALAVSTTLGGELRIDRAQASLQLGHIRLTADPQTRIASAD